MKEITVALHPGSEISNKVRAYVYGIWAAHANLGIFCDRVASVTHVPSGLRVDDLIGWAVYDMDAACAVAVELNKRGVNPPAKVWGSVDTSRQSEGWPRVIEAVAAETLVALMGDD